MWPESSANYTTPQFFTQVLWWKAFFAVDQIQSPSLVQEAIHGCHTFAGNLLHVSQTFFAKENVWMY
jgi:hypothetical protein